MYTAVTKMLFIAWYLSIQRRSLFREGRLPWEATFREEQRITMLANILFHEQTYENEKKNGQGWHILCANLQPLSLFKQDLRTRVSDCFNHRICQFETIFSCKFKGSNGQALIRPEKRGPTKEVEKTFNFLVSKPVSGFTIALLKNKHSYFAK